MEKQSPVPPRSTQLQLFGQNHTCGQSKARRHIGSVMSWIFNKFLITIPFLTLFMDAVRAAVTTQRRCCEFRSLYTRKQQSYSLAKNRPEVFPRDGSNRDVYYWVRPTAPTAALLVMTCNQMRAVIAAACSR